ncbi:hypothetical protein E2C01_031430 [Portunus trituberculatus]|uniref:Uncharacterized protein n=2 Tax=Portunus trituberculatus TaxID=210409 RepID=A0A5B7F025_PORTR|nr:hypothetical protein [Portunus trituberculatus]
MFGTSPRVAALPDYDGRREAGKARTVPPDRGVRRTFVLAFGNRYPEWMPFLTSDRGQDSNPCASEPWNPQSVRGPTAPRRPRTPREHRHTHDSPQAYYHSKFAFSLGHLDVSKAARSLPRRSSPAIEQRRRVHTSWLSGLAVWQHLARAVIYRPTLAG